jgi:hypothetical protein
LVHWYTDGQNRSSKKKNNTNVAEEEEIGEVERSGAEMKQLTRKLDRVIRWHTFLYHSTMFWKEIATEIFGGDNVDSNDFVMARLKVQEAVKSFKHRVLECCEVSVI